MKKKLSIHPIDTVFLRCSRKSAAIGGRFWWQRLFGDTFRTVWDAVGQKSNGNDPNRFDGWRGRRRRGPVVALTAASPNRTKSKNGRANISKTRASLWRRRSSFSQWNIQWKRRLHSKHAKQEMRSEMMTLAMIRQKHFHCFTSHFACWLSCVASLLFLYSRICVFFKYTHQEGTQHKTGRGNFKIKVRKEMGNQITLKPKYIQIVHY